MQLLEILSRMKLTSRSSHEAVVGFFAPMPRNMSSVATACLNTSSYLWGFVWRQSAANGACPGTQVMHTGVKVLC